MGMKVLQTKWIERKFSFNFPAGYFPCILERLRGTPARVEELITSFPPDILTVQIDNSWSIQEHAGHLYDLDELHEARIEDYDLDRPLLRPADMTNQRTYNSHHNLNQIETLMENFRGARDHFVKRLESFDEKGLVRMAIHPRLQQEMRLVDMAYFVAEHDDHHLARITSLANRLLHTSSPA